MLDHQETKLKASKVSFWIGEKLSQSFPTGRFLLLHSRHLQEYWGSLVWMWSKYQKKDDYREIMLFQTTVPLPFLFSDVPLEAHT